MFRPGIDLAIVTARVATLPRRPRTCWTQCFPQFPSDLLAATNPKVLRALARINYEETAGHFQRRAAQSNTNGKTHAGALTFVHRFGSSLSLHLHLHVCLFDGVFVERDNEALHFSPTPSLSKDELCELVATVAVRVAKWLRKHGFARDDQDSDSNETRVFTFDKMLAQVAAGRATLETVKDCHHDAQAGRSEMSPRPPPRDGAAQSAASTCTPRSVSRLLTTVGRERRCRSVHACAVFDRLRWLPDGRCSYSVKKSGRRACRV